MDLAELGLAESLRHFQDDGTPEEVTVKGVLNASRIVFPPMQNMRDAANAVELSINRDTVTKAANGTSGSGIESGRGESENPLGQRED